MKRPRRENAGGVSGVSRAVEPSQRRRLAVDGQRQVRAQCPAAARALKEIHLPAVLVADAQPPEVLVEVGALLSGIVCHGFSLGN